MENRSGIYIAGIGMITPVGFDTASTFAAVKAGISAYSVSDYFDQNDEPITMASIPDSMLSSLKFELDEGDRYNERHDRVTKMAIYAVNQACEKLSSDQSIPLILTMPENLEEDEGLTPIAENLMNNCQSHLDQKKCKCLQGDRSIGIEAIHSIFNYLQNPSNDYILIGGSDSYRDYSRLEPHIKEDRLLTNKSMDGFAPGEAACFLLLTGKPELALEQDGNIIELHPPGIAQELGHRGSDIPYLGEGLDKAFKQSLINLGQTKIDSVFSSMNGESHWAKEYGVAYMRNKSALSDNLGLEHPSEVFGDIGVATSPVLIGLAAEHLRSKASAKLNQVYCSSDGPGRAAIVIEKTSVNQVSRS